MTVKELAWDCKLDTSDSTSSISDSKVVTLLSKPVTEVCTLLTVVDNVEILEVLPETSERIPGSSVLVMSETEDCKLEILVELLEMSVELLPTVLDKLFREVSSAPISFSLTSTLPVKVVTSVSKEPKSVVRVEMSEVLVEILPALVLILPF